MRPELPQLVPADAGAPHALRAPSPGELPMPQVLAAARRVLAVRLDNIGDAVMLGPALRALRVAAPHAAITLLATKAGAQVAPLLPWVDDVIVARPVWQDASNALPLDPEREIAFARALAERQFDASFIFTSFSQTPWAPAYACYLAGIPVRVAQASDFGGSLLTVAVSAAPREGHQAERNLHMLEGVGIPVTDRHLELCVSPAIRQAAAELLAEAGVGDGRPFILAAPGASCPARRPDAARIAVALREVRARTGLPVVVAGSERDAAWLMPLLDPQHAFASVVGRTDVPLLAAIVEAAALVVSANSAPIHLADAFRTPLVALYSGTDLESQWRPRRSPHVLLRVDTPCTPCHRFECAFQMQCLDIAPQAITEAVLSLLAPADGRREAPVSQSHRTEVACVPSAS